MGLLDEAEDIHEIPKHLFTTLYGPPGVGKTIAAARTARKSLIFAGEKSYVSLSNFPEITAKAIPSKGYDHLTRIIAELYNDPRDYDHFMIDTVDDLIRRKLKEQRQKVKFNRGHEDISSLEDYNLLNNHMADLIARLAMLPISVSVISHDRLPDPQAYGKGDRLLRPSLPFKVFESLNGYANVVGYMHMRKFKVKVDGRDTTELRRVIALQANDEYEAKNHLKLPALVTDETFIETVRNWKGI